MAKSVEQPGVLVLLDLENIFFAAKKDPALHRYEDTSLILALGACINTEASRHGAVRERFAALSIAPKQKKSKIWDLAIPLVGLGRYRLLVVPSGRNSADHVLVSTGIKLLRDEDIEVCTLVTGDGKDPFPSLVDAFVCAGKKVHVLAYNYIPAVVKNHAGITSSFVAPAVTALLEQNFPGGDTTPPDERRVFVEKEKREPTIRDCFLRFVQNQDSSEIPPGHTALIREAILLIWEFTKGRPWEGNFGRIERHFQEHRAIHWKDRIDEVQTRDLINAILSFSGSFEQFPVYRFNPESVLVHKVLTGQKQ